MTTLPTTCCSLGGANILSRMIGRRIAAQSLPMAAPRRAVASSQQPFLAGVMDGKTSQTRPKYFDYQATTPMDPRVVDKMMPLMVDVFGNSHSRTHCYGWEAERKAELARDEVAKLINAASSKCIIFTSGATESNNLAIKGAAAFYGKSGKKKHIITTQVEHKCALASCQWLEQQGWEVTYLGVNSDGLINLEEFKKAIRPTTLLASIMMVNNEIGVIQPIKKLGEICRSNGVLLHVDGAQAAGKINVDVEDMKVDLMSISGHKIYGPKGIGALYVRSKPRVRLTPILSGGGQERGMRSGTLPVPLVVGFGEACRISREEMHLDMAHVTKLSNMLIEGLKAKLPEVKINGSLDQRYPGNVNISFAYVEGESLIMSLKDIAISSGSACTSASLEPSYVLRALGVDEELAHTSLRFGLGKFTTEEEVKECIETVAENVKRLRELSPLADFAKESKDFKSSLVWT